MPFPINIPIPQEKISECFAWRDWLQKLSNKVFGTMSTQDSDNISVTGGSATGVDLSGSSIPLINVIGAGTMASQDSNNVAITGGTASGVDLTGSSIPLANVVGAGSMASQNSTAVSITGGTVTATVGMLNTTDTAATVGTHGAPPAQVEGYVIVNIGGTDYKIPYYKT